MERLLQQSSVTAECARLSRVHRLVVGLLGWDTGGIQASKPRCAIWHHGAGTLAWWGRTKGSAAGIFLLTDCKWDLKAPLVGGKNQGSACPCLPPSSGQEGWSADTAAMPVFLSSHRPKIAPGLNASFFSNHFSSKQLHKGQPPFVHHRAR